MINQVNISYMWSSKKKNIISQQIALVNRILSCKKIWSLSNRGEPESTVAKRIPVRKVWLCVWWDWQEIIYNKLLAYDQTLNSELFCQ